jgi:hypothetical protein
MKNELCVQTEALALDAETPADAAGEVPGGEAMGAAPAEGDEVEFSGKGRITRTEGGNSYLEVTEVNGSPLGGTDMEGAMDDSPENLRADIVKTTGEGY